MANVPEIWVKPAEGRKVRLAGGGIVPTDGMPVAAGDFFIQKLLMHGDLVEMEAPKEAPAATTKAAAPAAPTGGTEVSASKSTGV